MINYQELALKMQGKSVQTKNLTIRPFRNSDEDGLFALFHDENTMRMDGDFPFLEKNNEFKNYEYCYEKAGKFKDITDLQEKVVKQFSEITKYLS